MMYTLFVVFGTDRSSVDETPTCTRAFQNNKHTNTFVARISCVTVTRCVCASVATPSKRLAQSVQLDNRRCPTSMFNTSKASYDIGSDAVFYGLPDGRYTRLNEEQGLHRTRTRF